MPEEKKQGLSIKPSGSFVSQARVTDAIQANRVAEEINKTQDDAEKSRVAAEEDARIKEIDKLLPEEVLTSYGRISYPTFRKLYSQVWDQVKEKEHLATGYCSFTGELLPGVEGTLRTLKTKENRALLEWTPATDAIGMTIDQKKDALYRNIKLAIGLIRFDGRDLVQVPDLTPENAEKWIETEIVKQKLTWLDSLPEEVTLQLSGIHMDVSNALRFALRENLKNRLAPPARS